MSLVWNFFFHLPECIQVFKAIHMSTVKKHVNREFPMFVLDRNLYLDHEVIPLCCKTLRKYNTETGNSRDRVEVGILIDF